jgi:hypothetical protein
MSDITIETSKVTGSLKGCFKKENKAFTWAVEIQRTYRAAM